MNLKNIFLLICGFLISADVVFAMDVDRVQLHDLEDGLKSVRVYLNYQDPAKNVHVMRNTSWEHKVSLPISSRWQVEKAHLFVKYVSSIALKPSRSLLAVGLNKHIFVQRTLNQPDVREEIAVAIPPEDFGDYNELFIRVNQHYLVEGCEDEAAPELWTEIDTDNSYVDLVIKEKPVPEQVSSIFSYLFDKKSVVRQQVHFVFQETPDDLGLFWAAFLSGSMGKYLSYRDTFITADSSFDHQQDNILIGLRASIREQLLRTFGAEGFGDIQELEEKIKGNINLLANPKNPTRALLVFTGNSLEELDEAVLAFPSLDFMAYSSGSIFIKENRLPQPAEAYSAPGFVPLKEKVLFSELGFKTTTFSDMHPPAESMEFKIYPEYYFDSKSQMKLYLHLLYPRIIRFDSIMNLFSNESFIYQVALEHNERKQESKIQEWLDIDKLTEIPMYMFHKGQNELSVISRMVPFKKGKCEIYNRENLQVTLMDDSYIKLPPAKRWVEMPYLDYIASAVYPYSIYPDLSDTAIVITDTSPSTMAALMHVAFFLSKHIGYPPYQLTVSTKIDNVLDKHIILLGKNSPDFRQVMRGAPFEFTDDGVKDQTRFIDKFMGDLPFFSKNRLDKKRYTMETLESDGAITRLVAQLYRSPYNPDKTVFSLISDDPENLMYGTRRLLSPEMLGSLKGDVVILSKDDPEVVEVAEGEETVLASRDINKKYTLQAFEIQEKYYQGSISTYDKIRFYISAHPLLLLFGSLLVVVLLVTVLRGLLDLFKQRHHKNAEK
jgi:hypothetical protein